MELGPQNHSGDGLLGPNSIIVVYVDPLGKARRLEGLRRRVLWQRAKDESKTGVGNDARDLLLKLYGSFRK